MTGFVFLVVHHLVFVDGCVLLACRVVNTDLAEQTFHTKSTRFVHQDRHHAGAECLVAEELCQEAHISLGGGNFTAFGGGVHHGFEGVDARHREALVRFGTAMRQVTTQRLATFVQIAHFGGVVCWLVERNLGQFAVWNRQIETVTEDFDVFVCQLLSLVDRIFAFARFTHAKTFDGFDQQDCWLTFVVDRFVISRVDLLWVVATAAQIPNIVVAHVGDHF